MRFNLASIDRYTGMMVVVSALLTGACGRGNGGADGGDGSAVAGAGGRGGTSAAGSGGTGGGTNAGTTGGALGGNGGAGGVGGGSGGRGGGAGGRGGGSGATGSGGLGGTMCAPTSCGSSEYCDLSTNNCVAGPGRCASRPVDCIVPEGVVCGCNGKLYASECEANASGVDIQASGGCAPPSGMFTCGTLFCTRGTQYCEKRVRGLATSYVCRDLPAGCGATPACACLAGVTDCACTVSTNGELLTTCQLQ